MKLKVGDKVWIRKGNDFSRGGEPSEPVLVEVIRIAPDWNFDAKPVNGTTSWCYKNDEIITHSSKKRKGKLIGEYPIQ